VALPRHRQRPSGLYFVVSTVQEERNYILQMVKKIRASGANVLLIQKSILRDAVTDLSLHYLVGARWLWAGCPVGQDSCLAAACSHSARRGTAAGQALRPLSGAARRSSRGAPRRCRLAAKGGSHASRFRRRPTLCCLLRVWWPRCDCTARAASLYRRPRPRSWW
jgi:hypothetical protein